jgi:multicomponent Na+:H+ antiporter subunit B
MPITIVEVALLAFALGCALGAALLEDTLAAVMAFAAYSLGVSVLWLVLQAPDVGLTEAAVGAGIMTILFLLALSNTVSPDAERLFEPIRWRTVALVGGFVLLIGATVPALPAIGDPNSAVVGGEVTQYYLENAYKQTEVKNAVTAVLAAYRGFDTLGEGVVVFSAVVVTLSVLRREVVA